MSLVNQKIVSLICTVDEQLPNKSYAISLGRMGVEGVRGLSLKSAVFPNNFYNVIENDLARKNNIFYFSLDGVPQQAEIPQGFYNISDLMTRLELEINNIIAVSGILPLPTLDIFVYSTLTKKVTISINGNGVNTEFTLQGLQNTQSINRLLGNSQDVTLTTDPLPDIYTFDSLINLQGETSVYLVSNTIANNGGISNKGADDGRNVSLIRQIPVNAPFGGSILYMSFDTDADKIIYGSPVDLTDVQISVTDSSGNVLNLGVGKLQVELICYLRL